MGPANAYTPPEGVNLLDHVATYAGSPDRRGKARVRVRVGAGAGLRRWAQSVEPDSDGWDVLTLGYQDPDSLASRLAGYGSAAVALEPPEVRDAVIRRLTTMAGETA
jgi:predicted DNA-binding transcriptional regulator YafY